MGNDDQPPRSFEPLGPPSSEDDRSSHLHRQIIGWMGLFLPLTLWLISGLRHTDGLPQWAPLSSVSAYYYSGSIAIFIGVLSALAVYLLTYEGYRNERHGWDRAIALLAGLSAVTVAFFPTKAPSLTPPEDPNPLEPSWWTLAMENIHLVAAITLFATFIFFSLVLFPMSQPDKSLSRDKRIRNRIYRLCGGVMVVCVIWALIAGYNGGSIFWPESLALVFFAVSWLAKGRADVTITGLWQRTGYYSRRPQQLPKAVWTTLRGE